MRKCCLIWLMILLLMIGASAEATFYSRGDAVAEFQVTTWDGKEISLAATLVEKEVVVLHIFSCSCGGCEEEMPLLQLVSETYADRVALIAVTIADADTDKRLSTYCTRRGLTFPVARDTAGLAWQYPIYGVPSTFLIDQTGVLRAIKEGAFRDAEEYAAFLEPWLTPNVVVTE